MAQVKEEVKIRPSNVLALADALRAATSQGERIRASQNRWQAVVTLKVGAWKYPCIGDVQMLSWDLHLDVRGVESSRECQRWAYGRSETSSCRGWGKNFSKGVLPFLIFIACKWCLSTQEAAIQEENEIRKHGTTILKADFKAFNLAISPRLEALLYSGEKLASLTDSPLLPSHLSLHLVNLSSQVTSTTGD